MDKLVTIVVIGRNDNYKRNFKRRLTNSINYNCKNISELGYDRVSEVLVIDWNSEIPLHKDLTLGKEAANICKFIHVKPKLALKFMRPNQVFQMSYALNVGIRRAESKYVLILSADMVMSIYALKSLFELLVEKTKVPFDINKQISFISTKLFPCDRSLIDMNLNDIDRIVIKNGPELKNICKELPGTGLGDIAMMNKQMWMEFRGYNEKLINWGWHEEELAMRVTQKYSWVNLSFLGIHAIDIAEPKSNQDINQIVNPHKIPHSLIVNDENWGLGKYKLKIKKYNPLIKKNINDVQVVEIKNRKKISDFIYQINSKEVKVNLYKPGKIHLDKKKIDWEVFKILSWYCINKSCRTFIQVGLQDSANSLMIVDKFPCSNFYVIESWKNNFRPHFLTDQMRRNGYRGHIRFISGDENSALSRLIESKNHKVSFDLSILQLEPIKGNIKNYIKSIMSYSSDESVLILKHNNKQELINIIDKNKYLLENCDVFYTKSGQVSIILKGKLEIEERSRNEDLNIIDLGNLPDWNWLVKINYKRVLFNPSKYIYHIFKIIKSTLKNI